MAHMGIQACSNTGLPLHLRSIGRRDNPVSLCKSKATGIRLTYLLTVLPFEKDIGEQDQDGCNLE